MNPEFLTVDEILEIHATQLARYGGAAGVRDLRLLESAAAQPTATFGGEYLHGDVFAVAAAYVYHIVRNHPFVDLRVRLLPEVAKPSSGRRVI